MATGREQLWSTVTAALQPDCVNVCCIEAWKAASEDDDTPRTIQLREETLHAAQTAMVEAIPSVVANPTARAKLCNARRMKSRPWIIASSLVAAEKAVRQVGDQTASSNLPPAIAAQSAGHQ